MNKRQARTMDETRERECKRGREGERGDEKSTESKSKIQLIEIKV